MCEKRTLENDPGVLRAGAGAYWHFTVENKETPCRLIGLL